MTTDAAIARAAVLKPIEEIAARAGLDPAALYRYGPFKAKVALGAAARGAERRGKLVLVTAISPTPAGEGKTTTTIGLGDALNLSGRRTVICLREPSLGPCFGMKGGANGGGRAQVVPQDEINLHLTGDFHAITAATNLLAAMIDNHVYWGNALGIDPSRVTWRRALDVNDRALRDIVVGLGNNGAVRQDGFDLTVASETMAAFCLATSVADLEARLGRMVIGQTFAREDLLAGAVKATGAMTALLRDAFAPNLVQTIDGSPALVHGGPFANIAHGCNSVVATDLGLRLADYVVTEAGFGADLGAEKFFDIKCRQAGLEPAAAVVVATVRALKMHGGVAKADLGRPDPEAVRRGSANLRRHVENVQKFGVPVVVAVNHFTADTEAELAEVFGCCASLGVGAQLCRHWAEGAPGALGLAEAVAALAEGGGAAFRPLYPDELPLGAKIERIARDIYRADGVALAPKAAKKLARYEAGGYGGLPVCMAKTPYSFSSDPALVGAPDGFTLPVRDVRLSAGAGFVVALCGDIVTLPGLPSRPAAETIGVDREGLIQGLF
ncbi:formate--tetrahydrofolate ligase [Lichenibacterium dinghuense]|uniref:formate--tetrahydrofolate ligase n=1 Tax=Lichenibacterium dinghuense TaxID=2895977 RepID=UPI001F028DAD|nr:formate--tetrahydrofolate ligase [Lichenibacterium sp. 6Y81]